MWKEFKEFALKGNVLDMAVGVIIGGAFGKIVTSVVNDLIMPVFGFFTAGMDFKSLKLVLSAAELDAAGAVVKPEAAIMYGSFLQNVVDFLIVAFSIFIAIRFINRAQVMAAGALKRKSADEADEAEIAAAAATPAPAEAVTEAAGAVSELELLTQIRDLLADRQQVESEKAE